jgi:hypothetical protein
MNKGNMAVQRSGKAELVLTAVQANRVDRIIAHFEGCKNDITNLATNRYVMGAELLELKGECVHGEFERIKTEVLEVKGISRALVGLAMQFSKAVQTKYPTVGYLKPEKFLTNGSVDERGREKVAEFFQSEMDGKKMTEFCRDLGMMRAKKPAVHHPRQPQSPEEKVAAAREAALGIYNTWMLHTKSLLLAPEPVLAELKREERQQMLDAGTQLNNEVRKFLTKKHS